MAPSELEHLAQQAREAVRRTSDAESGLAFGILAALLQHEADKEANRRRDTERQYT